MVILITFNSGNSNPLEANSFEFQFHCYPDSSHFLPPPTFLSAVLDMAFKNIEWSPSGIELFSLLINNNPVHCQGESVEKQF